MFKKKSFFGWRFAQESRTVSRTLFPNRTLRPKEGLLVEDVEMEMRIARAWDSLGEWFQMLDPKAPLHLRFGTVKLDPAGRALREVERRAMFSVTCSVWGNPELFDQNITGLELSLEALRARKIMVLSLNYELETEGVVFGALASITRRRSGTLRARGYTHAEFIRPKSASPRKKFHALVRHALELESLLEASKVELGSSSAGEDSALTGWRVRI